MVLREQEFVRAWLLPEEVTLLRNQLGFEIIGVDAIDQQRQVMVEGEVPISVNPNQFVGHFLLPTGRTVVIVPKIPAANVFRMLAYVYLGKDSEIFRDAEVLYARESLLFEPLVILFNKLVGQRARRGLAQDYVRQESNLSVIRGRIDSYNICG